MSLSADELAPDGDRGAARGSARAGQSESAPAREPDLLTLEGHTKEVLCAAALPDGRIATGSRDNSIRLWRRVQTQTPKPVVKMESQLLSGHKADVCALAPFSLEDVATPVVRLVSGSLDSNVRLWDLSTGKEKFSVTLADKAKWDTGELVREQSRGVLLLVMSEKLVRFHSITDGKCVPPELELRESDGKFSVVRVLPNAGTATGVPSGLSSKEKKEKRVFEYTVATGSYSGLVRIWRVRVNLERSNMCECECVMKLGGGGSSGKAEKEAIEGLVLAKGVLALAALPDGRLVSASTDRTLRLWNVAIRQCTATLSCENELRDVCALRDASRPNAIAVLRADKRVQLWDADKGDGNVEELGLQRTSEQIESSHAFFKLLSVGPESSLYCVLRELSPNTDPNAPYMASHSGRVRLWPISLPTSGGPRNQSSRLVFEDLKRVPLALEKNGSSEQLEVLNLSAVCLHDEDAPELLHYLRELPRLSRLEFSSAHCDLSPLPEADTSTSAEGASSIQSLKQAKLTARGLVRILVDLQRTHAQSQSGSRKPQVVSFAIDGRLVNWQDICECVEGRDAELHAEFVAASHASLVEEFTIAMDTASIEEQQLIRMFERVLCAGDLRWPYTLLNVLLSDPTANDRQALVKAFKCALEWLAQHAMVDAMSVADLKSVLRSAQHHRLLNQHECDTLHTKAVDSSVFSDARFRSIVSKVNLLRADLGALELRLTSELARLDARVTHVEKRVERVEMNVKAVAQDLARLREALRMKQRREAAFGALKVQVLILSEYASTLEH